ncbi:MAG: esterase family protein [Kiritimatiellaeota bacterium]|nr:esterase family protein [Kiritimatiellota bacterium]
MAFFQTCYKSSALNIECGINAILPDNPKTKALPCLWLLHGLSDDHTCWQRYSAIERHARQHQVGVVMPAVNRSFYTDMAAGGKYYTYMTEELPKAMRAFFPLSDKRADNFVAGLSMGGYGAFLLALTRPERYAAAASFSGAMDIAACHKNIKPDCDFIFGKTSPKNTDADLFHLVRKHAAAKTRLPKLSLYCGAKDFLYQDNLRMCAELKKLNLPFDYSESPTHEHTWDYWDLCVADFLKKLPVSNP